MLITWNPTAKQIPIESHRTLARTSLIEEYIIDHSLKYSSTERKITI